MRKRWIYAVQIVVSLMMVCGLAIGCAAPSSTPTSPTPSQTASDNLESYWVSTVSYAGTWMMLETVGSWEGENESRDIFFRADKAPWVINAGYVETSQIQSSFQVLVQSEEQYMANSHFFRITFLDSEQGVVWLDEKPTDVVCGCTVCEVTGDCVIRVFASGCRWWVKVGVE